jgi:hypothetical protein
MAGPDVLAGYRRHGHGEAHRGNADELKNVHAHSEGGERRNLEDMPQYQQAPSRFNASGTSASVVDKAV